jgi:adenylate kinase
LASIPTVHPSGGGFLPWLDIRDKEMERLKAEHGGLMYATDADLQAGWRTFFDTLHPPVRPAASPGSDTIDHVRSVLDEIAAKHDLADPEGRADFRQEIDRRFGSASVSALRKYAKALGHEGAVGSRNEAVRALAKRWIDRPPRRKLAPGAIVAVLGKPGSGKSTVGESVAAEAGVPHLSTGRILRSLPRDSELGRQVYPRIEKGELAPPSLVERIVRERLSQPDAVNGVVLDGSPRTLPELDALERFAAERNRPLTFLHLNVSEGLARERLAKRAIEEPGRSDDRPEVVDRRMAVHDAEVQPVVDRLAAEGKLTDVQVVDGPIGVNTEAARDAVFTWKESPPASPGSGPQGVKIQAEYVPAFDGTAYVARDNGLPVGYLTFRVVRGPTYEDTKYGGLTYDEHIEVDSVEVKPSHRRQGIADSLLARLRADHPSFEVKGGSGFTAEGAAWWKHATGEDVRVTQQVEPGSGAWDAVEAAFEERLHPRGRGGKWVMSMYHGASKTKAARIRSEGFKSRSGIIFATSHPGEAHDYAGRGGEVLPVKVTLKKPLVVRADKGESLGDKLREIGVSNPSASPESEREQEAKLRALGHDGVVVHYPEDERDPSAPMPARVVARVIERRR